MQASRVSSEGGVALNCGTMLLKFRTREVYPREGVYLLTPARDVHASAFYRFLSANEADFRGPFPLTMDLAGKSESGAADWLKHKAQLQADNQGLALLIFTPDDEVAGFVSAFHFDWRVPRCEVAWVAGAAHRGKGLVSEAMRPLLGFLFDDCGVEKVIARTTPENAPSRKLAEKLGFTEEGLHRRDFRDGYGNLVDVIYWSVLKDGYAALAQR